MKTLQDVLEESIEIQGMGLVMSLLEALCRAHAVRTEHAKHGLFVKVLYPVVVADARSSMTRAYRRNLLLSFQGWQGSELGKRPAAEGGEAASRGRSAGETDGEAAARAR